MENRVEEKKERLLFALDQGMTMIHLDARRPGVLVPEPLRSESHVLLNLSYRFDPPDLTVGDWGIRSTLTFQGVRFKVAVPWSALYAISSHVTKQNWMFPDDMPSELLEQAQLTSKVPLSLAEAPRAVLREVVMENPPAEREEPKPKSRGHLRLVK